MSRAKVAGRRANAKAKVNSNYLKDLLDERGMDYNEFATQMKEKFRINKKDTHDMIKGKKGIDLNDKLRINCILKKGIVEVFSW